MLNADGMELDRESLTLGVDTTPLDANPGSGSANLMINTGSASGFSMSIASNDATQSLGTAVQVVATLYRDGNPLILDSGLVSTDCTPPINVDDIAGSYTVTEVTTRVDEDSADDDPDGADAAPTLAAQKAFLEQLLTDNGWSYTLTETPADFEREFHTGGYAVYALLGEAGKLHTTLQSELREAVYRGEGLLAAGAHDNRNTQSPRLAKALGLKVAGSLHADAVVIHAGLLSEADGLISLFADEKVRRVKPDGAVTQGNFLTTDTDDDCDSHVTTDCTALTAALLTHAYGQGNSIFAGFDLLAAGTRDGADSTAATVLLNSLAQVHPASLPPTATGVLPLAVTVSNLGIVADARVTLTLPIGMTVIDPGTLTLISTNQLTAIVTIPEATRAVWTLWVQLPDTAGPLTVSAIIEGAVPGTNNYLLQATPTFIVTVSPAPTIETVITTIDELIAQGIGKKNELKKARKALARAQTAWPGDPAKAMTEGLKAAAAFSAAGTHPEIQAVRVQLGQWLWHVARQPHAKHDEEDDHDASAEQHDEGEDDDGSAEHDDEGEDDDASS